MGLLRRVLAFKTVYVVKTYGTDSYVVEAATRDKAKARLHDEGVNPSSVEGIEEAGTALMDDDVVKL